jgi:alpha-tubulin suppressor-like RCC1 family protein
LARKADGTLWGWGYNQIGQLANGTFTNQPVPVRISVQTNWAGVFPGNDFVLARQQDGSLWGWGDNSFGQLSAGVMGPDYRFDPTELGTPVRIGISADWRLAAGGFSHALAIRQDGTLWSWGTGAQGSLGLAIPGPSVAPAPMRVGLKTDWVALSAGEAHSVAADAAGGIWTWGNNGRGQLGLGTRGQNQYDSATSQPVPTLIQGFGARGFTVEAVRDKGNVSLTWSLAARLFTLEMATNLLGGWQAYPGTSTSAVAQVRMDAVIDPLRPIQFFRLHK